MKEKTKKLIISYKNLKYINEIMKVNLVFFLFFHEFCNFYTTPKYRVLLTHVRS